MSDSIWTEELVRDRLLSAASRYANNAPNPGIVYAEPILGTNELRVVTDSGQRFIAAIREEATENHGDAS